MQHETDEREPALRAATLSDIAARDLPGAQMVTLVIQHEPVADAWPQYEAWLQRIMPVAARFPGHRGASVIRPAPGAGVYTVILRFEGAKHAEDWAQSAARRALVAEVTPLLQHAECIDTVTGLEFWFAPAGAPQQLPRRSKQFLVTLSAIVPMTLLVPWALRPFFDALPWPLHGLVKHIVADAVVVGLITYIVMPRYVKLVARWLYR